MRSRDETKFKARLVRAPSCIRRQLPEGGKEREGIGYSEGGSKKSSLDAHFDRVRESWGRERWIVRRHSREGDVRG